MVKANLRGIEPLAWRGGDEREEKNKEVFTN